MRNKFIFSLASILTTCFIIPVFSQTESITITTYYPAPFGVYQNLRLFPTTTVPNCATDNDEGVMYYDNTVNVNQLMVCRETAPGIYGWGMAGSSWTHPAGTNILYTNGPDWNVGIGTTTPERQLHLKGVNPIILFEDDEIESGTTELTNFMIQADNGVARLTSDRSVAVFLDSDNDDPDTRAFMILKDNFWFGPSAIELFIVQENGNVGIGTSSPSAKLEIGGVAGTDGIKYPDGTKQTSAKLSCVSVSNTWGPVVNGQSYPVSCPADYVGVTGRFEYYDTNSVQGGAGGVVQYHGVTPCSWNANRTVCTGTVGDAGISAGQVLIDCCRIP
ncbi:MAG: hypothetical protein Q8O30_07280 [Candidatus Omnitrophota bacterium]|nr:hypothetical protein [Candidatus Omnitrophota bacterium]